MRVWELVGAIVLGVVCLAFLIAVFVFIGIFVIASFIPENYNDMTDDEKDAFWEEVNKKLYMSMNRDDIL